LAVQADEATPLREDNAEERSAEEERRSAERRGSPRRRLLARALVTAEGVAHGIEVMVRDLSDKGARIALMSDLPLAERLHIAIPDRGFESAARLVWRRDRQAGLRFELQPSASDAERIDALEGELRKLKRQLNEMRSVLQQRGLIY
jgi:hypothetical protein